MIYDITTRITLARAQVRMARELLETTPLSATMVRGLAESELEYNLDMIEQLSIELELVRESI